MIQIALGEIIEEIDKKTTDNNEYLILTSSQRGIVSQAEYFKNEIASKNNIGYKIIEKGQFTYRSMSDTGYFYINLLKDYNIGIVSPAYPVFSIKQGNLVDVYYLEYIFKSSKFLKTTKLLSKGSTRLSLKFKSLCGIKVFLPSVDKQKEIVKKLNIILDAIENRKLMLTYFNNLIESKLNKILNDNVYKEISLIELTEKINNAKVGDYYINYFDISSIDKESNKILNYKTYNMFEAPSRAKQIIQKEDILFSLVRPNLKNVAKVNYKLDNMICSTGFIVLRANYKVLPDYIFRSVLSEDFTNKMVRKTVGSSYPALTPKDVLNEKIKLVDLSIQKEFVEYINLIEIEKEFIQQDINCLESLFETKMHEYFD